MKALYSLFLVLALAAAALVGAGASGMQSLFGIVIPYLAVACFVFGFSWRVVCWAQSPVPFRIPTTCGQQSSLPWIKQSKVENPSSTLGVIVRMAFEVLLFRSLFRNTQMDVHQ